MHQSFPGVRLRRDSHPSIHLPRSVYLSGIKVPRPGFNKFSFSAKKSSLQRSALPPRRSAARSVRLVNDCADIIIKKATIFLCSNVETFRQQKLFVLLTRSVPLLHTIPYLNKE